jgi:hypothetical protein
MDAGEMPRTMRCQRHSRATSIGRIPRPCLIHTWYDADGNQTSLSATVAGTADFLNTDSYDNLNREIAVSQQGQTGGNAVADKLVDVAYNSAGDTTAIDRYSDLSGTSLVASSAYGYDGDERLTSLTHTASDGTTTYADYAWTYDVADRVKSYTNSANIADYSSENIGEYDYDADGQLLSASANWYFERLDEFALEFLRR